MNSFTVTDSSSTTFSLAHAKYISSKVAADLKRIQRLYTGVSDQMIADYEAELIEYVKAGYVETVFYGFQKNNQWIEPTLRYTARDLYGLAGDDDDPGRITTGADISGAYFTSYLTYSRAWYDATDAAKAAFKQRLPFGREGAPQPTINGYLVDDRNYSAGGRALSRSSVRSFK